MSSSSSPPYELDDFRSSAAPSSHAAVGAGLHASLTNSEPATTDDQSRGYAATHFQAIDIASSAPSQRHRRSSSSSSSTSSSIDFDVTEDIFHPLQQLRLRRRQWRRSASECSGSCILRAIRKVMPSLRWLPQYNPRGDLLPDLLAGVMLAIVAIPQGMAYAVLANLDPIIGLYSCLIPPVIYAFFGTSPSMHIGPFALVSLLVSTSVASVVPLGSGADYTRDVAFVFSILVGAVLLLMSFLRLGFAVSFLADCVLSAYTCAAAVLILTSQLKSFLGLRGMPANLTFIETLSWIMQHIQDINMTAFLLGLASMVILLGIDELNSRYKLRVPIPSQLVVVVLGILVAWIGKLDVNAGLKVIGDIPSGLPPVRVPGVGQYDIVDPVTGVTKQVSLLTFANLKLFIQPVCMLALIAYIISISIAKNFAMKENEKRMKEKEKAERNASAPPGIGAASSVVPSAMQSAPLEIDANQELFALGLANLLGGFVSAYPAAGSLSRSALVYNAGVKSSLHNVFAAVILLFVLLLLTPLLYYLPTTVLAAIIFIALKSLLLQYQEGVRLYSLRKQDFIMWFVTFIVTLFFDTQVGIAVGLIVSLAMLLKQTSRPPVSTLGKIEGTDVYTDLKQAPAAETTRGVLIWSFDAPLHFANKDYFRTEVVKAKRKAEEKEWKRYQPVQDRSSNDNAQHSQSIFIPQQMRQQLQKVQRGIMSGAKAAGKVVKEVGKEIGKRVAVKQKEREMEKQNDSSATSSSEGYDIEESKAEPLQHDQIHLQADAAPINNSSSFDPSSSLSAAPIPTRTECRITTIIFDCRALIDMDDAALKMISGLPQQLECSLYFCGLNKTVKELFMRLKLCEMEDAAAAGGVTNVAAAATAVVTSSSALHPRKPCIERPFPSVHAAMRFILKQRQLEEARRVALSQPEQQERYEQKQSETEAQLEIATSEQASSELSQSIDTHSISSADQVPADDVPANV